MTYDFDQLIDRRASDSAKWHYYGENVLPLWVADMDFPAPEPVIRALRERAEHGVFGYPIEPPELRPVILEQLQRLYGWQLDPEALIFLPGVVTGFNLATHAVTSPGDAGCTLDEMELTRQPDGSYAIDFDAFAAAITERTRIFILCNPHNPVGRVFRRDELERMAEICLQHNLVICSDEIHCDLLFSGQQHLPIASLAPEIAARTITLMAPSKTYNIAGIHASIAIIPDPELREQFEAARAGLVPRLDTMGYTAMLAAYRDGRPWLDAVLRYMEATCDFLIEYVNSRLPGITAHPPEGTYLAWLDCRQAGIPGNPHQFFLERAQVAVNDGATFGRGGEGFVRLNFACPRSTLAQALHQMRQALLSL
jgi:cystathionine beta-lyase